MFLLQRPLPSLHRFLLALLSLLCRLLFSLPLLSQHRNRHLSRQHLSRQHQRPRLSRRHQRPRLSRRHLPSQRRMPNLRQPYP